MTDIKEVIKNLSDGNIYALDDIAMLTNTTKKYVEGVLLDSSTYKTCGDGSGVIYYMDIKYDTIVDGVNFRNTVYCAKCNIHCDECQNPQSWDIRNGKPISINNLAQLLLENGNDITFSGGECSLQAKGFTKLAKILKKHGKNIWLYSGKKYEDLIKEHSSKELLDNVDILVDGKFIKSLKNLDLLFRGSSNQRIIDLNKTRKNECIIEWTRGGI